MSEGLEDGESIPNPFLDESESEELAESTDNMSESQVYFDEESGEMKMREVSEEELSDEDLEEKSRIAELRTQYEVMRRANETSEVDGWGQSLDKARGELVAALKERRSDLKSDISELGYFDDKEELKSERESINSEIEELSA